VCSQKGMPAAKLERICPHCGAHDLTFLEHGSGVTVFQCGACARATVQRWQASPALGERTPSADAFEFPAWFKGAARG
jgi:hypothetical protein